MMSESAANFQFKSLIEILESYTSIKAPPRARRITTPVRPDPK
jgi:hypothetical protein